MTGSFSRAPPFQASTPLRPSQLTPILHGPSLQATMQRTEANAWLSNHSSHFYLHHHPPIRHDFLSRARILRPTTELERPADLDEPWPGACSPMASGSPKVRFQVPPSGAWYREPPRAEPVMSSSQPLSTPTTSRLFLNSQRGGRQQPCAPPPWWDKQWSVAQGNLRCCSSCTNRAGLAADALHPSSIVRLELLFCHPPPSDPPIDTRQFNRELCTYPNPLHFSF